MRPRGVFQKGPAEKIDEGGAISQVFGRNYQAACPTTPDLSDMATEKPRTSDGEKTMASFIDGICNLIGVYLVLGMMFGIYIAPLIIAMVRGHHRLPWIGLVNFAAGWTVVGWIAALAWSVTAIRQPEIPRIGSPALRSAQLAAA
jgi:hypothetical protein